MQVTQPALPDRLGLEFLGDVLIAGADQQRTAAVQPSEDHSASAALKAETPLILDFGDVLLVGLP